MERRVVILSMFIAHVLSSCQSGPGMGVLAAGSAGRTKEWKNDTIVRMTLEGADCPFADHAEYGVFIPAASAPLRGVLILQHGCTMEQFGITRPYDLQYQAFAKKWNLAIIETAIYGNCHIWKEPDSGSGAALFKVLRETGKQTGHLELKTLPWLLWGHSAGGYWALAMLRDFPERILAIVSYSAAGNPQWSYSKVAAKVPLLLRHAGADDGSPDILCWATASNTFQRLRKMDAPVSVVHNRGQNHNFSYIRYMAIPFYEAVLKQRLPKKDPFNLRDIHRKETWLGDTLSLRICKESDYLGDKSGMCLFPDQITAKNWVEFVSTGTVVDKTPPPAPHDVHVECDGNNLEITWSATADIESGILKFNIYQDGMLMGSVPETGPYQSFDTNGDNTAPIKIPEMKYVITGSKKGPTIISIESVNHFNLVSKRTNYAIP